MSREREHLKNLRLQKGLTQQEVADKLGVSKATISKYEKGQRKLNHTAELAKLYGVDEAYIFLGKSIEEIQREQALNARNRLLDGLNSPQTDSPEYTAGYKAGHAIGHANCLKEIMAAPTDPDELRAITHSLLSLGYPLNEVKLMSARLSLPTEDLEAFIQILDRNRNKGG